MAHPPCDRLVVAFELNQRPHPKGRPRFGKGRVFTDAKTVAYEAEVASACKSAMNGNRPTSAPVEIACLFEQRDARVADLDNLVKAVSDAINGIAFADDKQVCKFTAVRKIRADVDRVSVAVINAKETK